MADMIKVGEGVPERVTEVTPELIHMQFILGRINNARYYLDLAREAYEQDSPDAAVMALDVAGKETMEARQRVIMQSKEMEQDDG